MIPCLFRCMAPHIYPPTHQNPIFHSFFPTTFSNSIPLPPPHPRITKYCLNEHTINFPPFFPTFQTSFFAFSTSKPLAPKRPNLQRPIFQRAHQQPSPSKLVPFSPQKLNRFCHLLHQPFKNCTPKALFHDIFHQNQPTCPPPHQNH